MHQQRLMVLCVSLSVILGLAFPSVAALANTSPPIYFEDIPLEFEGARPYIEGGRTLVPAAYVSRVLEAQLDYDQVTGSVIITKNDDELSMKLGSREALVNGITAILDAAPMLFEDEVMLPLRFVSEALGAWVEWWNADQSVRVYSSAPTAYPMANLMNEGLVTGGDGWVYYTMYDGIYRSRRDGSELIKVADTEACHLNKWEDWLIFSPHHYNFSTGNEYSGSPWVFRIPVNGGEPEEIAHVEANQVTVVGDYIYYSAMDHMTFQSAVYRMKVDGSDREPVATTNVPSRFYIDGDWIYYTDDGICRAKTDGTTVEQVSDLRVQTYLIVSDGWIYCVRVGDGCLLRVSTDGTEVQELFGDRPCQGINVVNGWVYFGTKKPQDQNPDEATPPAIFRMRLDGTDVQVLATLDEDAQCRAICVQDGWVFFETMARSKTVQYGVAHTLYRMNTDGSNFERLASSE